MNEEDGWQTVAKRKAKVEKPTLQEDISRSSTPLSIQSYSSITTEHLNDRNDLEERKDAADEKETFTAAPEPLLILSWTSLSSHLRIQPRGLVNTGNMCFLNAVLQSLLFCSPLFKVLSKISTQLQTVPPEACQMPYLRAFCQFFQHFSLSGASRQIGIWESSILPEEIYECIRASGQAFHQGLQEDAQEFLTFILDKMHEELISAVNAKDGPLLHWSFPAEGRLKKVVELALDDHQEWLEMGRKQKVSQTRTLSHTETPISFLFFGQFRSVVRRPGSKDSITMEPFHCLSVNIDGSSVHSLHDALCQMSRPERIGDSATTRITKQIFLYRVPPVLIIQLNRFVYNLHTGRVEKVSKALHFPERLVFDPSYYKSPATSPTTMPSYRLFAVIYHHGRSAGGGHYTAHVRRSFGMEDPWYYINDTSIRMDGIDQVVCDLKSNNSQSSSSSSTPYLLFYQRSKDVKPEKSSV